MKFTSLILLASVLSVSAQAPRKDPLNKYRQLWDNSLVTEKPVVDPGPVEAPPNELDDYVLAGWTQTGNGYLVSLINTKDPKERQTIAPGMPNEKNFQVLDVKRDPTNYKSTQILITMGPHKRWIGYEDKFLTLQQPPAATPQPAQQQAQPPIPTNNNNARSNNNNNSQENRRQPRVRRVPVPPQN
ncbi:hypothetical protein [Roseibacillus ishigakijimensis]|uniref:Uncharacterized protein n=1 Tax=Roseibacillus ishigakijimensis TaxID=454146 RepID=A0A934VMF7_9BACT|nr:hypothetical protein [Roseibacillus ishigakijimensis]MBK1833900.1 hypothetical protein [Roseibacillus ishigakijimensis]